MVSDQTKHLVWTEVLNARRVVRYYDAFGTRCSRFHSAFRIALLTSITAGFATMLSALPDWVHMLAYGLAALLTVADAQLNFGQQAAILKTVGTGCTMMLDRWEELDREANAEGADEQRILARVKELSTLDTLVTSRASAAGINHSRRLNDKHWRAVLAPYVKQRHA